VFCKFIIMIRLSCEKFLDFSVVVVSRDPPELRMCSLVCITQGGERVT